MVPVIPNTTRGGTALKLTLTFGALEILTWLVLGWARVGFSDKPIGEGLVDYVTSHFGEITIGLATTAYVIFTYQILIVAEFERA
jgi:hypothetical protein